MLNLYTVRRRVGGTWHEDAISAGSWEEAQELADELGGEITDRIAETYRYAADENEDMDYGEMLALVREGC